MTDGQRARSARTLLGAQPLLATTLVFALPFTDGSTVAALLAAALPLVASIVIGRWQRAERVALMVAAGHLLTMGAYFMTQSRVAGSFGWVGPHLFAASVAILCAFGGTFEPPAASARTAGAIPDGAAARPRGFRDALCVHRVLLLTSLLWLLGPNLPSVPRPYVFTVCTRGGGEHDVVRFRGMRDTVRTVDLPGENECRSVSVWGPVAMVHGLAFVDDHLLDTQVTVFTPAGADQLLPWRSRQVCVTATRLGLVDFHSPLAHATCASLPNSDARR